MGEMTLVASRLSLREVAIRLNRLQIRLGFLVCTLDEVDLPLSYTSPFFQRLRLLQFDFPALPPGLSLPDLCLRLVEHQLLGRRVDLEEEIPFLDGLARPAINPIDPPADPGTQVHARRRQRCDFGEVDEFPDLPADRLDDPKLDLSIRLVSARVLLCRSRLWLPRAQ